MSVNGLEKITEQIYARARAQADEISREAEEACLDVRAEYSERRDAIREKLSGDAQMRAADLIARTKASVAEKQRKDLQAARRELLESVYRSAEESLLSLDAEAYTELLAGLLTSAMLEISRLSEKTGEDGQADARYEAYFSERDGEACRRAVLQKVKKKLAKRIPEELLERLSASEESAPITGGVVLRWKGGEIDRSFGAVMAQLHPSLDGELSKRLFEVRGQSIRAQKD